MGHPEDRTHGADSAINDTLTDDAAFGGAPHMSAAEIAGSIRLDYNVQNFNALMAANTAQQTEISSLTQTIAERDGRIEELLEDVRFHEASFESAVKMNGDLRKDITELKSKLETAGFDAEYADDRRQEIQRKFDRQSGYLDRVLDQEDGYDTAEAKGVTTPAPRPAVGPDFSDIAPPRRRQSTSTDGMPRMAEYFEGASVRMLHPSAEQTGARPRRN